MFLLYSASTFRLGQGFGLATPAGAVGYGSFNCVRENVSFENTKQKNGNDFQEISRLKVEKQK